MSKHNIRRLLNSAAAYVTSQAESLKASHTINGQWHIIDGADEEAKQQYDRETTFAAELRAAASRLKQGGQQWTS